MAKFVKCAEHDEIFKIENTQKRWIQNWSTFVLIAKNMKITWQKLLNQVETIPFKDLKNDYPVGETMMKKTVTTIVEGKKPKEIFYPIQPPAPVRKMTVLGSVLTGCEHMAADIGCTHIIGNGWYWGDWDLFEELGGKSIINVKPKDASVPSKELIEKRMELWIDRPGCAGWWIDNGIRGEEPDGQPWTKDEAKRQLELRQWFYKVVRDYDPDIVNHPVVEQFNMTEQGIVDGHWRSGWKGQYRENPMTCDLNLWTCYTAGLGTAEKMYEAQLRWFKVFPFKYMTGKVQLIPQISLEHYWERDGDNSVKAAYRNWKKIMADHGLAMGGLAYYKDTIIRGSLKAQNAIREVNRMII